jgi:hypothetical protein
MCHNVLWCEACQLRHRRRHSAESGTNKSQGQPKIGFQHMRHKYVWEGSAARWVAWGKVQARFLVPRPEASEGAWFAPRLARETEFGATPPKVDDSSRGRAEGRELACLPGLCQPFCWFTGTASDDTELGRKKPDRCARACSWAALNTELRGEARHTREWKQASKPERQTGRVADRQRGAR